MILMYVCMMLDLMTLNSSKISKPEFLPYFRLYKIQFVFCYGPQVGSRGDWRQRQHEGWYPLRQSPLRGPGSSQMAVRRVVQRRHPR